MIQLILIISAVILIIGIIAILIKYFAMPQRVETVRKLIKQGKNQAAAKLAKQIIAKNPKDYPAHYYLGKAYLADNRGELALIEFKMINENALFGPTLPEVPFRQEFAALQMKFNHTEEALKEYLILTKLDGMNAVNFLNAGKIYEQMNRKDLALGFYQRCIKLEPKNAQAHGALGHILFLAKQYVEAKRELDLAIRLSPETYANYYYLGKLLKEAKDLGAAVKAFDKAQRDSEFKQKALIERATCYIIANRYDNAQIDLQRAIDLDKDESKSDTLYARYFLASCYEQGRKIDKAIEQWEKIYKRSRSFRDVAAKLQEYKDLQANDNLKDYLTCSDAEFAELCKNIALKALGLAAQQIDTKKDGCQIIASEAKDGDWRNMRKQMILLRFYRDPEPVEDTDVREVLEKAKAVNCTKAYIFISSEFARGAVQYAENRPVELVSKIKLEEFLAQANK
ncbi:MAG: tetratricopeptide repeat protein [Treponema sp.]